jgi:N-acetyl-beta-hexosaminidase
MKNETIALLQSILTELAGVFADDFFHIGADEVSAGSRN